MIFYRLIILAGLLLPCTAWAEGAVRVLECKMIEGCDADGNCKAAEGAVTFNMAPVELQADGSGDFLISYSGVETDMKALSDAGPFYWTMGNERNTLLASSETRFLWHRLKLDLGPVTTIEFLDCEFHQ